MAKRKGLEQGQEQGPTAVEVNDQIMGQAVSKFKQHKKQIEMLEAQCKELAVDIEARLLVHGVKAAKFGNLTAVQCNGRTASRLDDKQLLLAGVESDVIKACTVAGREYTYIQVREDKPDAE